MGIRAAEPNLATESPRAVSMTVRDRVPVLGLTEYWYPALVAGKVGRDRPETLTIVGQTLVFFRDEKGEVAALARVCPHRGAYLSHGRSHFKGTLTCPYHGWTFDARGECVAVLGEGPESEIPGSRGSGVRAYPTRTLRGVVFVWMGEGKAAPVEEDVPPELFSDRHLVFTSQRVWNANWRPSIENFSDAHVYYLHRNSIEMILQAPAALNALAHSGPDRPQLLKINNRALSYDPNAATVLNYADRAAGDSARFQDAPAAAPRDFQDVYPALGGQKWPPTRTRLYFSRIAGAIRNLVPAVPPMFEPGSEWGMGVHLPCTVRVDYRRLMFTRFEVPIDEHRTNNFYFISVRKGGILNQAFWHAYMKGYYLWKTVSNFSAQDGHMAQITDYAAPERLSASDKFPREWRRFVVDYARRPGVPASAPAQARPAAAVRA